jgi:adenylyltransferase/sulfurtransferase
MTCTIKIPSPLRKFTGGEAKIVIPATTVESALTDLFNKFPGLKNQIVDDKGLLRNFVNLYLNGEDIRYREGVKSKVTDGSELRIIPAIAGGTPGVNFSSQEMKRYARHFTLPEFGTEGQKKLKTSKVLVIGAGGLGCPVLSYLTAAGVGTIGIVDFDVVDESNLQRQILFGVSSLGKSKSQNACNRLMDLNPHVELKIFEEKFTVQNALKIAENFDLIIDGTDNFPTRYLVNDVSVLLKKPNIYGSIFRFEGQASVFSYEDGPCYRCLYPEPPTPGLVPSCAEGGVLGVLPGIVGSIQATEAIKVLTGMGESLKGYLLLFDALSMEFQKLPLKKNPQCAICGGHPSIRKLVDYEEFCGLGRGGQPVELNQKPFQEISVHGLKEILDNQPHVKVIDVREEFERDIAMIPGTMHIPMGQMESRLNEFDKNEEIVVHCKMGGRSAQICQLLVDHGFTHVRNVVGGITAWAQEIDDSVPTY